MSVTRNVIIDLLPACAAGEAHADSLKLVEEWATRDAAIAAELAALRDADAAISELPRNGRSEAALVALRRTRRALRAQALLMGFAIFFTALPFSFGFTDGRYWWLARENPGLALTSGACAVAMWLGWFLFAARLRVRSGV